VTLPALSWVQLDGTWVNVDGRAQRLRPAFGPQGEARAADRWLLALAERWGTQMTLPSPQTVRAEIARSIPSFGPLVDVGPSGGMLELGA
jgi:NADH dehydrogenase/NADH:ubiquinone oxidoreductase subunit G